MLPRTIAVAVACLIIWVIWCFFVVDVLVPALSVYLAFWPWIMAWIFCVLPVILIAAFILIQTKPREDS